MIISMAWTTPAFLAGRKTCTRRHWPEHYARKWKEGTEHVAWSKLPRTRAGYPLGRIRIIQEPYLESTWLMPDSDYEAEGFAFFDEHPELLPQDKRSPLCGYNSMREAFSAWRVDSADLWVVRFEPVEIYSEHRRTRNVPP